MGKVHAQQPMQVPGLEDTQVSVEIMQTLEPPPDGHAVKLNANDNQWPHQSAYLTTAAARTLARYLLEIADEADLLNLEAQDVNMACTTCGNLVRKSFGAATWQHRDPEAALACTATGPVKARVATG